MSKKKGIFDFENLETINGEGEQITNTENIKNDDEINMNIESGQENNSIEINNKSEQLNGADNSNNEPEQEIVSYKQYLKTKPLTVEETHTRDTVLIENGLLREINKLAKRNGKGYKKWLYNTALRAFLDEMEDKK